MVFLTKKAVRFFFIIVLSGMVIISCSEEFLDLEPQGVLYENTLANREGIEKLLIAAYGVMDGVAYMGNFWEASITNWIYGEVYADNAYKGSYVGDQPVITRLEQYIQQPNDGIYISKWKAVYDGVSRCNLVLRVIELAIENSTIDPEDALQYKAEARFLRGFYHLEAIKMWDFIPYVDETVTVESPLVENYPSAQTETNAGEIPWGDLGGEGYIPWDKVEEDFRYAIDLLHDTPRNNEKGRAYKYPALCLLGKIKWYQGEHNEALDLFNKVINSGRYSLAENYHDNFRVQGDNNAESIFQYQASIFDAGVMANSNMGEILNFPFAYTSGIPGYDFFHPSQNLVNAYKTTDGTIDDIAKGLPYLSFFGLDFNKDDVISDEPLSSEDPFIPDTRSLDPRLDWTVGRRGIPFLDWGVHPGKDWIRDPEFFGGPYHTKKMVHYMYNPEYYIQNNGPHFTAINYNIIRYADILLMAADCEAEMNNLVRARELVNKVRSRMADHTEFWVKTSEGEDAANYVIAEYPIGGISDPFQTKEGALEAIRFERRLELAMEGHRFWDLKKWGIVNSTIGTYLEKEKLKRTYLGDAEFKDYNIRHPIPHDEIDLSKGYLVQNPGYN